LIAAGLAHSITRSLTCHAQYGPADAHSPPIIAINSKEVYLIVNYDFLVLDIGILIKPLQGLRDRGAEPHNLKFGAWSL
jgi:hypothetical protein